MNHIGQVINPNWCYTELEDLQGVIPNRAASSGEPYSEGLLGRWDNVTLENLVLGGWEYGPFLWYGIDKTQVKYIDILLVGSVKGP